MKPRVVVLAALLLALLALGPAAGADKIYQTPHAVFEAAREATKKKDYKTLVACFCEEMQKEVATDLAWAGLALQARAEGPKGARYKEQYKPVLDVLSRHGLGYSVTKKFKRDGNLKEIKKAKRDLLVLIKDPARFAAEMMAAEDKLRKDKEPVPAARLADMKIEGDRASATIIFEEDGKDVGHKPVRFVKVGGSWKIAPAPRERQ